MQQPSPYLAITAAEVAAHDGLSLRWAYRVELAELGARPVATDGQSDVLRPDVRDITLTPATGRHVPNRPTIPPRGVAW